jgi:hypothetical protein
MAFLRIDNGARQSGMGSASCGLADDIYAIYWNPAGLVNLKKLQIGLSHNKWFQNIGVDSVAIGFPFGKKAAIALSASFMRMDKIPMTTYTKDLDYFTASAFSINLSYARRISEDLRVGGNLKFASETIGKYKSNGIAFDFGVLHSITRHIDAGLCIQNLSKGAKFIKEEFDLPLTLKAGLSYKLVGELTKLMLVVDVDKPIDEHPFIRLGAEYWVLDVLAIRGGYCSGVDVGSGISFGVGLHFKKFFELNYAYIPKDVLGKIYNVSLLIKF